MLYVNRSTCFLALAVLTRAMALHACLLFVGSLLLLGVGYDYLKVTPERSVWINPAKSATQHSCSWQQAVMLKQG